MIQGIVLGITAIYAFATNVDILKAGTKLVQVKLGLGKKQKKH